MGLLKKLQKGKKKGLTIGKASALFVNIDEMKKNRLLETTAYGFFKTFPEVIEASKNKETFCKNLYIYARNTGLIAEGESLDIIDIDPEKNDLLATITGDKVNILI